jgi:hypothetical protein
MCTRDIPAFQLDIEEEEEEEEEEDLFWTAPISPPAPVPLPEITVDVYRRKKSRGHNWELGDRHSFEYTTPPESSIEPSEIERVLAGQLNEVTDLRERFSASARQWHEDLAAQRQAIEDETERHHAAVEKHLQVLELEKRESLDFEERIKSEILEIQNLRAVYDQEVRSQDDRADQNFREEIAGLAEEIVAFRKRITSGSEIAGSATADLQDHVDTQIREGKSQIDEIVSEFGRWSEDQKMRVILEELGIDDSGLSDLERRLAIAREACGTLGNSIDQARAVRAARNGEVEHAKLWQLRLNLRRSMGALRGLDPAAQGGD